MKSIYKALFLCFLFGSVDISIAAGVCSKTKSAISNTGSFYFRKYYCCENFEHHATGCKECPTGFMSDAASTCKPCPNDRFGFRCVESCLCQSNERCDNVLGCIKKDYTRQDEATTDKVTVMNMPKTEESIGYSIAIGVSTFVCFAIFGFIWIALRKYCPHLTRFLGKGNLRGDVADVKSMIKTSGQDQMVVEPHEYMEIDENKMCRDSVFVQKQMLTVDINYRTRSETRANRIWDSNYLTPDDPITTQIQTIPEKGESEKHKSDQFYLKLQKKTENPPKYTSLDVSNKSQRDCEDDRYCYDNPDEMHVLSG